MVKCPRCGKTRKNLLALSRLDNKTKICDQCGTEEALEAAKMIASFEVWANGRKCNDSR